MGVYELNTRKSSAKRTDAISLKNGKTMKKGATGAFLGRKKRENEKENAYLIVCEAVNFFVS